MGGGLMQLVAYGAQDIYLTGNPQITFFKVVYRRHTNFAIEAIEQTFTGSVDFGRKISCVIDRNGDLLHKMYLEVDMELGCRKPAECGKCSESSTNEKYYATRLGHALIQEVSIEIGGQCMDTHYGEWLELWSQLTMCQDELVKHRRLIDGCIVNTSNSCNDNNRKLYIPLQFWFNRNPGLALPLIALQYHEVKINVILESALQSGLVGNDFKIQQICLFCDYIFLDTDERRRFAQVSHEYLIEQLQFNNITSVGCQEASVNVELRFNHPVKELVWTAQPQIPGCTASGCDLGRFHPFDWSRQQSTVTDCHAVKAGCCTSQQAGGVLGGALDTVLKAKLQLNGHDRFREREGTYFRCVQPFQHHTGASLQGSLCIGDSGIDWGATCPNWLEGPTDNGFFYVYSFALKPEEHQPSGTCNFSRIDNAVLQLGLSVITDGDPTFIRV
jgi:hypothetical protein